MLFNNINIMENQKQNCPYCNGASNKDGNIVHQSIYCYNNLPKKTIKIEDTNIKIDDNNLNPSIKSH